MGLCIFIQWLLTSEGILLIRSSNRIHISSSYSKPPSVLFLPNITSYSNNHSPNSFCDINFTLHYHFLKNPSLFIESILVELQKILFHTSLFICIQYVQSIVRTFWRFRSISNHFLALVRHLQTYVMK